MAKAATFLQDPGELLCFQVWLLTLPPSLLPIERTARGTEQMGGMEHIPAPQLGELKLQAHQRARLPFEPRVSAETPGLI